MLNTSGFRCIEAVSQQFRHLLRQTINEALIDGIHGSGSDSHELVQHALTPLKKSRPARRPQHTDVLGEQHLKRCAISLLLRCL